VIRFTKDEKLALFFLVTALLIGTAVLYYKNLSPAPFRFIEFREEKKENEKININKAGSVELTKLKGIGQVFAVRIISYREENGPFHSAGDIRRVKGIGDKTYDKIKDQIAVE